MDSFRFERRTALFSAVGLALLVGYLIVRNQPFADNDLRVGFRTLLSLAVGILGGSIPGFLEIKYSRPGLSVRAIGAMALFLLTYEGSPGIRPLGLQKLPSARVEFQSIAEVSFRSELDTSQPEADKLKATAYVDTSLNFKSVEEPARKAVLDNVTAEIRTANRTLVFEWYKFTNWQDKKPCFSFICPEEDKKDLVINSGEPLHKEILYKPNPKISWKEILALFTDPPADTLILKIRAHVNGDGDLERSCKVNLRAKSIEVKAWIAKNRKSPSAIDLVNGECAN